MIRHLCLAAFCAMLGAQTFAQGAEVRFGALQQDTSAPVEVTADSLSIDQNSGRAVYSGNVLIVQDTMRLSAAQVVVIYAEGAGRIDRLEASGGVTLVSGEEAAEAARADYDIDRGTVVMTGDVLLTQGPSLITGERMVVDLDGGTASMSGRVRTLLQQQDAPDQSGPDQ